jgi:two-component system, OmpR family, sensor kinase
LLLSLAYVLVLAIVALGVPLAFSLRDRVDAEIHSQALSQADVVAATAADLLSASHAAELGALVRSSGAAARGRVLILAAHGRVLADSAGSRELGVSYASRPEIAAALRGRAVQTQRASHSLGEHILATAVPVIRNGATIGAVRITQSVGAVQRAVNGTIAELGLIAATVLLLGLLAGGLIARQVALPLRRLEGAARRLAGGELDARAALEGSSEQRSLSASFNEMADRVQRMIGAQREFVADASHELRTPLSALRLRVEEARAAREPERVAAELDAATAEVDRLAAIVDELLVLSRAEDRELEGETVDLLDAVSRAVQRWQALAETLEIELTADTAGAGTAWCARADIDRVLDALIENALRYSRAGGAVLLSASDGRLEVRDRGPGLTAGEEAVVFERFHRGSAGRQGPPGSGLGLAIARTLTRAWHGEATLRNRPDGGAVAVVELPAASS